MKYWNEGIESKINMAQQIVDMTNYMKWNYAKTLSIKKFYERNHSHAESLKKLHEHVNDEFMIYMKV